MQSRFYAGAPTMTEYQPINCEWHDELEVAAMRQRVVTLAWQDENGQAHQAAGRVRDIEVRQGEEFVLFDYAGHNTRIRLDRIRWQSFPLRGPSD